MLIWPNDVQIKDLWHGRKNGRSMPVQPKWNVAFVASFQEGKGKEMETEDTYKEQNSSTWKEKDKAMHLEKEVGATSGRIVHV